MTIIIEPTGNVKVNGKKAAILRNNGALCDIRRHGNGFLYSGGFRVAVSEELLESLSDTTVLQFTHLDTKDVWTCTVHDFRHFSEPVHFAGYEPQRACKIVLMNHTIDGTPKKQRKNELQHIDVTPIPEYRQQTLFG
jgi:hypothetical protein